MITLQDMDSESAKRLRGSPCWSNVESEEISVRLVVADGGKKSSVREEEEEVGKSALKGRLCLRTSLGSRPMVIEG